MRSALLCSTLLASLAIPAAAHADTFTFTPTASGVSTTFTLNASTVDGSMAGHGFYFDPVTTTTGAASSSESIIVFYDPATYAAEGKGQLDLYVYDDATGTNSAYSGQKLYSGSESAPVFLPGTYDLGVDSLFCDCDTVAGTLVIASDLTPSSPSAVTPEPSSLVLLGTGALSLVGAARRRFLKA